jgi:hypothetical protein
MTFAIRLGKVWSKFGQRLVTVWSKLETKCGRGLERRHAVSAAAGYAQQLNGGHIR